MAVIADWGGSMEQGTPSTGQAPKEAAEPSRHALATPPILSLAENGPTLSHALREIRDIRVRQ
jgi:hypothetical protein